MATSQSNFDKWDFISRSTTGQDGNIFWLQLPNEQLSPKDYKAVNQIVESLRGKWVTKAKRHHFDYDFRNDFDDVLSIQTIPDANPFDYFPTPADVVSQMVEVAKRHFANEIRPLTFLEPSAGQGAIVDGIIEAFSNSVIYACEIDERNYEKLLSKYSGDPVPHMLGINLIDFVADGAFKTYNDAKFDAILMNPPFRAVGDPTAYITHINKAYSFVNEGGLLVSVAPSSIAFRTDKKTTALRQLIEANGEIIHLPEKSFKDSGTLVNCVLVVMRK